MRRSATLDCLRIRRTGERSSSLSRRGKSRTNVLSVVVPLSLSLSRISPFTSTSFLSLSSFHSPLALFLTSSLSLYSLCYVECKRKTGYTLRLDILHVSSLDIRNKPFHCFGFSLFPPFFKYFLQFFSPWIHRDIDFGRSMTAIVIVRTVKQSYSFFFFVEGEIFAIGRHRVSSARISFCSEIERIHREIKQCTENLHSCITVCVWCVHECVYRKEIKV